MVTKYIILTSEEAKKVEDFNEFGKVRVCGYLQFIGTDKNGNSVTITALCLRPAKHRGSHWIKESEGR